MDKSGAACHAERLCALLAASHGNANRMLAELTRRRRPEALCAARAPFVFEPARGQPRRAIPAEHFHRSGALALETVELTLYGYCVLRRSGWNRRPEAVLEIGRPPLWRRLLRAAPLLALCLRSHDGTVTVHVEAAGPDAAAAPAGAPRRGILLAPEQQQALLQAHRTYAARRKFSKLIPRW